MLISGYLTCLTQHLTSGSFAGVKLHICCLRSVVEAVDWWKAKLISMSVGDILLHIQTDCNSSLLKCYNVYRSSVDQKQGHCYFKHIISSYGNWHKGKVLQETSLSVLIKIGQNIHYY